MGILIRFSVGISRIFRHPGKSAFTSTTYTQHNWSSLLMCSLFQKYCNTWTCTFFKWQHDWLPSFTTDWTNGYLKKLDKIPTASLGSVWLLESIQNGDYYKIKTLVGKIGSWQTSGWSDLIVVSRCSVMLSTRLNIYVLVYVTSPGFLGEKKNSYGIILGFFSDGDLSSWVSPAVIFCLP